MSLAYLWWQLSNYRYWHRILRRGDPPVVQPPLEAVVIIPARNEEGHIGQLLEDLLDQSDRDPIIVVDDDSQDTTRKVVSDYSSSPVRLLRLKDYIGDSRIMAHKKAALTYGIGSSQAPLIITTDADCRRPPEVNARIKSAFAAGYNFICGPVLIDRADNFCAGFQALDMAAYMLLTAAYQARGRPLLANGAHLSFSRDLFVRIEGYEGIDHLPSGDDVLLLQKALKDSGIRTTFLTDPAALVSTVPMPDWWSLWQQRLRWAGKTGAYTNPELNGIQAFNFLVSLSIVVSFLLALIVPACLLGALLAWIIKAAIDFLLLRSVCAHFNRREWMRYFPMAEALQPIYLVAIGTASLMGFSGRWKGR